MTITRAVLDAFLDDALSDAEAAQVERALRTSEPLRQQLQLLLAERDRGEHTLGAIWRRERLSCPTREQLGNYFLEVLEADEHDYVSFHLKTIGCHYCQANLADLEMSHPAAPPATQQRRRKFFESSAGYLKVRKE